MPNDTNIGRGICTDRERTVSILDQRTQVQNDDFAKDVQAGLSRPEKTLPFKYFYDDHGSELFEEICSLDSYYLTRKETEILRSCCEDVAAQLPACTSLVELGSGSSRKTRVLLDAFLALRKSFLYCPLDISAAAVEESTHDLATDYPQLSIASTVGTYECVVNLLDRMRDHPQRLIAWLGSSIGNFEPSHAEEFLCRVRSAMKPQDKLLVGIDLHKSTEKLEQAYNDDEGVTARFNKNLLSRINRELDGDFDLDRFHHHARFESQRSRIEMHLVSKTDQTIRIEELGMDVEFERGESIHTENSYKYSRDDIENLAAAADLRIETSWTDDDRMFSVNLFGCDHA